jgi:MoaA/NifB/PqqE/SkfB family radical SAM enzyme
MTMILNRLFQKSYPELDWVQIEISSHCNAACIYCPHTEYRHTWRHRHLPKVAVKRLIPAFTKTTLIYLQGWGEPLLHPDFFDLLKIAKNTGCMVGTTTNATLLNKEQVGQLIEEGLDIIGFSLAGIDEKNDRIREGTSITQTLDCIEMFHREKSKRGATHPKLHIAYMLFRSGLQDLEKIPSFLARTGVDQTVVSSLSLALNRSLETESILAASKEEVQELKHRFCETKAQAGKLGVDLHFHIVSPQMEFFKCGENVNRAVVVGSDGCISPCVFTQIPASGENFYFFKGSKVAQRNLSFGNIEFDSLNNIWNQKAYRKFLSAHRRGQKPEVCNTCLKGYITADF